MSLIEKIEERLEQIDEQLYSRLQHLFKAYHAKRYQILHCCLQKTVFSESAAIQKCLEDHSMSNEVIQDAFLAESALYSACYQENNSASFDQGEEQCLAQLQKGLTNSLSHFLD